MKNYIITYLSTYGSEVTVIAKATSGASAVRNLGDIQSIISVERFKIPKPSFKKLLV